MNSFQEFSDAFHCGGYLPSSAPAKTVHAGPHRRKITAFCPLLVDNQGAGLRFRGPEATTRMARSKSSSMARPISLAGARSSASSMMPSATRQESDFPLDIRSFSSALYLRADSRTLLFRDHSVFAYICSISPANRAATAIALEAFRFAVSRPSSIVNGACTAWKRSDFPVVRQCSVEPFNLRLRFPFGVRRPR